jgi:hypothetical protein
LPPALSPGTADVLNCASAGVTIATADPTGDDDLAVEATYGVKLVTLGCPGGGATRPREDALADGPPSPAPAPVSWPRPPR